MRRLLVSLLVVGIALVASGPAGAHPSNVDHSDEAVITPDGTQIGGSVSFDCVPGEAGELTVRVTQGEAKAQLKISYTCPAEGTFAEGYGMPVAHDTFEEGTARALVIATSLDGGKAVGREIITLVSL
jgi:hypothetical protein